MSLISALDITNVENIFSPFDNSTPMHCLFLVSILDTFELTLISPLKFFMACSYAFAKFIIPPLGYTKPYLCSIEIIDAIENTGTFDGGNARKRHSADKIAFNFSFSKYLF